VMHKVALTDTISRDGVSEDVCQKSRFRDACETGWGEALSPNPTR
jgi:hypothetical protein